MKIVYSKVAMFSQLASGRFYGVVLATMHAFVVAFIVYAFGHGMSFLIGALLFVVLWIGIYFTGLWAILYRPKELDKRIPISSKELRKKKKQFYDELDSLRRR